MTINGDVVDDDYDEMKFDIISSHKMTIMTQKNM